MTKKSYYICERVEVPPDHDGGTGYEVFKPVVCIDDLVEARADARKSPWRWGFRPDDKDAPASIASDNGYAVLMCPRYGIEHFEKDADFVCLAANTLSNLERQS